MQVTVACIQTNSQDDLHANIAAVEKWVGEAAKKGAQLIALPENVFYMEKPGATDRPNFAMEEHPGILAAKSWAKTWKAWLLVGSVAVTSGRSAKRLNRSLLINDQGEIVSPYDKIHLFDVELASGEQYLESSRFEHGEQAILAATPWGRLGMTVCYDVRFPHLYRALAKAGAQMLAVPSAFTAYTGEAHWHVLLRARAIENGCFVIAPAQCGTHPGNRKTFGHSLIVDPWGKILADGGTEPGVILTTLDMAQVEKVRKQIPSLQHDRNFNGVEAK